MLLCSPSFKLGFRLSAVEGRKLGRWLFQNRGWTPIPLFGVQLFWAEGQEWVWGFALILIGEAIRLWAVGHIGPRSRTRGDQVGTLESSGPFARLRNPLYLGNGFILLGVGAWGGLAWMGAWALFFLLQYGLVVRWEEAQLLEQLGAPYEKYKRAVPRWLPLGRPGEGSVWSARVALRSERATLVALAFVSALYWLP
jgi:protein-S-isoprenylcysteine O-methyltransferase Ste14